MVKFDQLREADQLVIRTTHSTYIFLVSNPAKRYGMLVGGVLGDYAAQAVLEIFPYSQDHFLKAGQRVRFIIESSVGIRVVTTSVVTALIHRRAEA